MYENSIPLDLQHLISVSYVQVQKLPLKFLTFEDLGMD